jgi:hypothetical protein
MTNDDGRKPEGAPERSPKAGVGAPSGVDGNGPKRFSVQRKMAIVARLLRGEPLELVARETNVSIARLTEWRERALAGAATALKERERDDRDDEIARLKSKVGVAAGANPHFFGGTARCRDSQPVTSAGRLWLTSKPCKGGPWPRLRRLTALTGLTGQPSLATKGSTLRSG